ncbi:MAG: Gfo/Idh/MocA family protein, partial [Sphingobacteriales bacterium]
MASGGKMAYPDDAAETPDTLATVYDFGDFIMLWEHAQELEKNFSMKPAQYGDYQKLLSDKNVDVVIIGTPDHWHCLQAVEACQAGKDVYVEKPIANSIAEVRTMVAAQEKYNRVVQVGQCQRSHAHFQSALDVI